MKKLVALLSLVCTSAFANLIDLTPGGFDTFGIFAPPVVNKFIRNWGLTNQKPFFFFDSASALPWRDNNGNPHPPGWVSLYGVLNGGTYFNTDLFALDPTNSANVTWDFTFLSGYTLGHLYVEGQAANGDDWANLYKVHFNDYVRGSGVVSLPAGVRIESIAFFGRTPTAWVPDNGSTFALMAASLVALLVASRVRAARKP